MAGGVAADGAVGQRGRAAVAARPPPPLLAELPLMVQLVSVVVPPLLYRPPPLPLALPPVIVSPEIDAVTPASTWNTRLVPPPLTVTPAAGPVIVSVPRRVAQLELAGGQGDRLWRCEQRSGRR